MQCGERFFQQLLTQIDGIFVVLLFEEVANLRTCARSDSKV